MTGGMSLAGFWPSAWGGGTRCLMLSLMMVGSDVIRSLCSEDLKSVIVFGVLFLCLGIV